MTNAKKLWVGILWLATAACSPKIYVNDRHTILEEEAAGEWPEFEKDLLSKTSEAGPTAFQTVPTSEAKQRLYNVLNGDAAGQPQAE